MAEFKNNSSFISTESYQQILPDYEDLITSLQITSRISSSTILFQAIKLLSRVSHDLSVVVPSDSFYGCLID